MKGGLQGIEAAGLPEPASELAAGQPEGVPEGRQKRLAGVPGGYGSGSIVDAQPVGGHPTCRILREGRDEARRQMESVGAGPLLADALHSLAAMSAEREDYQGALGYYKKLAEGGERSAELFYNTGLILQNLGRMDEAARQYREAVAVSPELVEASQALARMVNGSGSKDPGVALPPPVAELLKTR